MVELGDTHETPCKIGDWVSAPSLSGTRESQHSLSHLPDAIIKDLQTRASPPLSLCQAYPSLNILRS